MFAVWPACNGADGISDIEGKVTRVGASECGQRASFNRDRDLAGARHRYSSVFGCRNACGLDDRIDIVEVDDRDFRLVDGAAAIFFIWRFNDLTFQRILGTPKPFDTP
jgi:hypothetical protein